jgi:L,D-peptidoglycan transpeptidase YkuD (ErfK/YbiS/YcfS/YnhG family)
MPVVPSLRRRGVAAIAALGTAALSLVAVTAVTMLAAPAADAASAPQRIITVRAASASSTTAVLDLWQNSSKGGYWHAMGPVTAYVGERGVGQAHEGIAVTPAGVFTLTQAFGSLSNPGTGLPYFQTNRNDWWDGESGTPRYNTHVIAATAPGPQSENLYDAGYVYSHAVVIDYNRFPVVAGAGSAFFLHVTNGQPTAGCVAVAADKLATIMRWLIPAAHPVISIGVGSAATDIVTKANAAAAAHNPIGHLDSAMGGVGTAKVAGWAADPDNRAARLSVDVYLDNRMRGRYTTGVARPDVAATAHTGPNAGFAFTLTGIAAGQHKLCVYGLNIGLGTGNTAYSCRIFVGR